MAAPQAPAPREQSPSRPVAPDGGRRLLFVGAFLSGAGALGLQLAWTRRLAVHVGHELPASLAVLTAFFLGVGLGAWCLADRIRRSPHPGRWVMGVELVIASWALLTLPLISISGQHLPAWLGTEPSTLRFLLVAGSVTLACLLPATIAMGATFPAFERLLVAGGHPHPAGPLYAVNTAGAVAGVVAALAGIQPRLGLVGATLASAGCHFAAAMLAVAAASGASGAPCIQATGCSPGRQHKPRVISTLALLAAGGFLGIGIEVLVLRSLGPVLGGTVYTHGLILVVWLGGTAIGSAAWHRWGRPPGSWLPVAMAAAVAGATLALGIAPAIVAHGLRRFGSSFAAVTACEAAVAVVVLLPLTLVGGAWFTALLQRAIGLGIPSGVAVGVNTLAAAIAPVAWGAMVFPALGPSWTWVAMAGAFSLVAVLHAGGRRRLGWMLPLVCACTLIPLIPDLLLLQPPPGARVVRMSAGATDTVAIWEWPDRNRSLTVNNRFTMGGTAACPAAARHAHIPLLLHPAPHRALFLGLGTGISFAAAGQHPDLVADGVELVPEIVAAILDFHPYSRLGPGLRVHTADARRFIRATPTRYDVIVSDLFHPERDGTAWLYTEEHFGAVKDRLEPGGIACQWLPWFQLGPDARRSIVGAWVRVFPEAEVWLLRWTTLDTPVVGLFSGPGRVPPWEWDSRVRGPALRESLRTSGLADGWQLWGCWVGPASSLLTDGPTPVPNTDDRPVVSWSAARGADLARSTYRDALLAWLGASTRFTPSWAGESPLRWQELREARDSYLQGLEAELRGRSAEAATLIWRSVRASGDFPTGYSHLLAKALGSVATDPAAARRILEELTVARPDLPVAKELLRRIAPSSRERSTSQE